LHHKTLVAIYSRCHRRQAVIFQNEEQGASVAWVKRSETRATQANNQEYDWQNTRRPCLTSPSRRRWLLHPALPNRA
jgi:hypothetical protein